MTKESRQQAFLERAKEAAEHAAGAKTPAEQGASLKIAEQYRDLAKTT